MKVSELIEALKEMPQDADVTADIRITNGYGVSEYSAPISAVIFGGPDILLLGEDSV